MALNVEDLKSAASEIRDAVSELKVDIQFLVQEAERKPKEANKLFGVDRMTETERKKALRRTSLVRFLVLFVNTNLNSVIT